MLTALFQKCRLFFARLLLRLNRDECHYINGPETLPPPQSSLRMRAVPKLSITRSQSALLSGIIKSAVCSSDTVSEKIFARYVSRFS